MKLSRMFYALLFGILGAVLFTFAAVVLQRILGMMLWMFVFGDAPWPKWAEGLLNENVIIFSALLGLILGAVLGAKHQRNRINTAKICHCGAKFFDRRTKAFDALRLLRVNV